MAVAAGRGRWAGRRRRAGAWSWSYIVTRHREARCDIETFRSRTRRTNRRDRRYLPMCLSPPADRRQPMLAGNSARRALGRGFGEWATCGSRWSARSAARTNDLEALTTGSNYAVRARTSLDRRHPGPVRSAECSRFQRTAIVGILSVRTACLFHRAGTCRRRTASRANGVREGETCTLGTW